MWTVRLGSLGSWASRPFRRWALNLPQPVRETSSRSAIASVKDSRIASRVRPASAFDRSQRSASSTTNSPLIIVLAPIGGYAAAVQRRPKSPRHRVECHGELVGLFAHRVCEVDHLLEVNLTLGQLRMQLAPEAVELARHQRQVLQRRHRSSRVPTWVDAQLRALFRVVPDRNPPTPRP